MRYIETTLDAALKEYPGIESLVLNYDPDDSVMTGIIVEGQCGGFKKHKHIRVKIALDEGRPVAWAWTFNYYRPEDLSRARAYLVFVRPSYRRSGIGTDLYAWAMKNSRELHRSLHVFPWDKASRKFYIKVRAKNKFRFLE